MFPETRGTIEQGKRCARFPAALTNYQQFWRIVALVPVATFVAVLVGGLLGGVPLAFLSAFTGG